MSRIQIIRDEAGNPAYAVLPWNVYRALAPDAADSALSDEELYDAAIAAAEEHFPIVVADRLMAGEHPVKVFREYRGLTQKQLAKAAGLDAVYLSQIETGKRRGSTETLRKLARALDLDLDDLVV
jgi:DNA-binding XRE family transcriptional regulator